MRLALRHGVRRGESGGRHGPAALPEHSHKHAPRSGAQHGRACSHSHTTARHAPPRQPRPRPYPSHPQDTQSNKVRAVVSSAAGTYVSTVAGSSIAGTTDGVAGAALFHSPAACVVAASGLVVYVATYASSGPIDQRVRVITFASPTSVGVVTTLAGGLANTYADGLGTAAAFRTISGLIWDASGTNLIVSDTGNNRLRITSAQSGLTSTLAGGTINTGVAGGWVDGSASNARLYGPRSVALDSAGVIYVVRQRVCARLPHPVAVRTPSPASPRPRGRACLPPAPPPPSSSRLTATTTSSVRSCARRRPPPVRRQRPRRPRPHRCRLRRPRWRE